MGLVACPSHVDAVPRRAVRKVGPRPDLTRSPDIGEPCGPARLLGDGSRSSCSPYRATNQSTGGGGMKNGGSNPPAPGNRCVGAPGRPIVPSRGLLVLFPPCSPFLSPPRRSAPGHTARTSPTAPCSAGSSVAARGAGAAPTRRSTTAPTPPPPRRISRRSPPPTAPPARKSAPLNPPHRQTS